MFVGVFAPIQRIVTPSGSIQAVAVVGPDKLQRGEFYRITPPVVVPSPFAVLYRVVLMLLLATSHHKI